jgi:hypothetical protein
MRGQLLEKLALVLAEKKPGKKLVLVIEKKSILGKRKLMPPKKGKEKMMVLLNKFIN